MPNETAATRIAAERERLMTVAREIWEDPELALEEHASARRLAAVLEDAGFEVTHGVGGLETAFVAEYGTGKPTIGILGEYDALPGLSQAVSAEREPIDPGGPGHGCGHNLFGTAAVGAALGVAAAIAADEVPGTVRCYGCPAEETLVGKVFMARAGAFEDLDAAVTWHPSDLARVQRGSSLALDSVEYTFHGRSAHAAASPEAGRSALDAVQLMNTGAEYLREHIPEAARIHYTITDGGDAPNVVPDEATVWYYVRAPTRGGVERVGDWLDDVAEGAATMTRTRLERQYVTGCYDFLVNDVVADVLQTNIEAADPPDYDADDRAFAADLQATFEEGAVPERLAELPDDVADRVRGESLFTEPVAPDEAGSDGSTDVGDVSWITPTAQIRGPTWPVGTPGHSWQAVAANGDFAIEAVPFVATVLAGAVCDLLGDEDRLRAAQAKFAEATAGRDYTSPLPPDLDPPAGDGPDA